MTKPIVHFTRKFQLWTYLVSHGQLLLRSTKDAQSSTQVDVLFKNVGLLSIPTLLDGLAITESSRQELEAAGLTPVPLALDGRKVFGVEGNNWRGFITAGYVSWSEDDAEYYSDSKLIS